MFISSKKSHNKLKKLFFAILTSSILLVTVLIYKGYGEDSKLETLVNPSWQNGDWWIMEVWQAAIHRPVRNPPWEKIKELKFIVKEGKKEFENNAWLLQINDINRREIGVDIDRIEVYYDKDFNIIGAKGFGSKREKPVSLGKYWTYTLFKEGFFTIPNDSEKWIAKEYKIGLVEKKEKTYKIDINPEKNEYQLWQKDKPWWIYYQNESPPMKCQVTEWSQEEGVKSKE